MRKAELINLELKKDDQRIAEMSLTPQQRIDRVFQLMDLATLMSSTSEIAPSSHKDHIPWIELRLKNDFT